MITFLFLDLDDTILDFHKAERIALKKTIAQFGVEPTEEVMARYHVINKWHWEQMELGKLNRDQVRQERFRVLFQELGVDVDAALCTKTYEENLAIGHYFLPGAEEAVERLSKKYRLFLASNGTASVQKGRLTSANLYRFFEKVFVSEEMGCHKPSREYFDACFAQIPGFDPASAMIVGDSLTSDIRGGLQAGIHTVWINPEHKPCGAIQPEHELEALHQLEVFLEEQYGV